MESRDELSRKSQQKEFPTLIKTLETDDNNVSDDARSMSGALRDDPLSSPSVEEVLDRLASSDALVVPASVARTGGADDAAGRRSYLSGLLQRNPAVFLERHGALLEDAHLRVFDHLQGDYEVDFHLARLKESRSPTPAQTAAARRVTRMRRLAHLDVLESQGHFTEHAMRLREPVLFHQHVGAAPGTREGGIETSGADETERAHAVSLALLAREDDRDADAAVAAARGGAGAEDDAEYDARRKGKRPIRGFGADAPDFEADTASRAARVASFRRMLRERFLDGGDPDTSAYARVDVDASLDESFAAETARDAEDKYFEEE